MQKQLCFVLLEISLLFFFSIYECVSIRFNLLKNVEQCLINHFEESKSFELNVITSNKFGKVLYFAQILFYRIVWQMLRCFDKISFLWKSLAFLELTVFDYVNRPEQGVVKMLQNGFMKAGKVLEKCWC